MHGHAGASLSRRVTVWLALVLAMAALILLGVWAWIGQQALEQEHEAASMRMSALFEASLRNAMLKRDLPGLRGIIDELGHLPGLTAAALLTPLGEVRFASDPARLQHDEAAALGDLCLQAACAPVSAAALRWREEGAGRVLRLAYPVHNEARCQGCHGDAAAHPVNGVLLLDFAPMAGEQTARVRAGTWLLPAVLAVLLGVGLAVAAVLRRQVMRPVAALGRLIDRLGQGELQARSPLTGSDELARLGRGVDEMAARLQAQMARSQAQSRFLQSLLDAAPDAMVLIGADHRIVTANLAYGRLLGRPVEELQGQPCFRMARGQGEPCPATLVSCPLVECRTPGAPPLRTVMGLTRSDGLTVDVEIDAAALLAPDGERQVIEVLRPLQDRVRFSQEQRLSAIGLLANGVAHEIHNPLASIRLALQSSLRGLRDGSIERDELIDYLKLVDEQIDRCVLITQRLLRLSQPSAQLAQPVSVRAAVDDVVSLLREEARAAGVEVAEVVDPPMLRVLGDEGELRQLLVNLMQNAIHAMPDGGRLTIDVMRHGGQVRLCVADTGCGIPADRIPLVFLPFYSRRADGRQGTGLGLAICKSLVEQRGGRISATSVLGQGSRFEVLLPDADAGGDAAAYATADANANPDTSVPGRLPREGA